MAPDVIDVVVTGLPTPQPNVDLTGAVATVRFGGGTAIPADGLVLQARGLWVEKLASEAVPGSPITIQLGLTRGGRRSRTRSAGAR